MDRFSSTGFAVVAALLLGTHPGYCDRLRGAITADYGTASAAFGLDASPIFSVPAQVNGSSDFILSGILEYVPVRRWPVELGLAAKGSFAFSGWNLGAPATGVYDSQTGFYDLGDQIHISGEWWALAAMGTMHVHLGPFVTLDGAFGYGPYGYLGMSYWDDYGLVAGPVVQGSSIFPQNAWGIDWSAGFSFGFFPFVTLLVEAGMMGPDFVAGLGLGFAL
jgi:hypothetical protein